jgi:dolichol-phosphate mannosyltransferase
MKGPKTIFGLRWQGYRIMKKACVVLPTYNEVKNIPIIIPLIFEQSPKVSHELHVVVVDDNSPDGTQDAVIKCMGEYPNLHLITGEKKGIGEAYKRGMSYATEVLNADLIFEMDADLQHDPAFIPLFATLSEYGFSLVIGSRFAPGGITPNFPLRRRFLSLIGNWLIRLFAGLPRIHDCTSGYRCIKADLIKKCNMSYLLTRGYSFQSSLLYELLRNGARVIEVPITFPDRIYGESKLGIQDQLEFILNLGRIRFHKSNEFIKLCLVGISGVLVNIGIYIFLTRMIAIPLEFAALIAMEISILSNYTLNNFWTFEKRQVITNLFQKLVRFHIVSGGAAVTNYTILILLAKGFGFWDIGANLIGIAIGAMVNYFINPFCRWKDSGSES